MLPIRPLNDPNTAVASLTVNQASMEVTAELGGMLADTLRRSEPEVVIGLPTLGLSLAPIVAQNLGLSKLIYFNISTRTSLFNECPVRTGNC